MELCWATKDWGGQSSLRRLLCPELLEVWLRHGPIVQRANNLSAAGAQWCQLVLIALLLLQLQQAIVTWEFL